jgi:hypothetical protein
MQTLHTIPSRTRFVVQRYAGTAAGWVDETETLARPVAERRAALRRAVRGDLWAYRVAPVQIAYVA